MVLNKMNHSCGLKSAASSKLRVSTLRDESKYLMTIRRGWQAILETASSGLIVGPATTDARIDHVLPVLPPSFGNWGERAAGKKSLLAALVLAPFFTTCTISAN
jgi:hypothetical protein